MQCSLGTAKIKLWDTVNKVTIISFLRVNLVQKKILDSKTLHLKKETVHNSDGDYKNEVLKKRSLATPPS